MKEVMQRQRLSREARGLWLRRAAALLPALLVALALAGCGAATSSSTEATTAGTASGTSATGGSVGTTSTTVSNRRPAPDFSGTTVAGEPVSLAGYAGRPLVLAFWASW